MMKPNMVQIIVMPIGMNKLQKLLKIIWRLCLSLGKVLLISWNMKDIPLNKQNMAYPLWDTN